MPSIIAVVLFFCVCLGLQWSLLKGSAALLRRKVNAQATVIDGLTVALKTAQLSEAKLKADLKLRRSRDASISESVAAWERAQRRESADRARAEREVKAAITPPSAASAGPDLSGRRLLAVTRERPDVAKLTRELLDQGVAIHWAAEGGIALGLAVKESCGPNPFSGVIVDAEIEGVEALQLVRTLRKMPAFTDTPIVMVARSPSAVWLSAARRAGATAWLQKPLVRWQVLGAMLGAWVDGAVRLDRDEPTAPEPGQGPQAQGGQHLE